MTLRRRLVVGVAIAAGFGCSGAWEHARLAKEGLLPGDNRRACARWVEHVNGLDACLKVTYEVDNLCAGVDDVPVDLVPWFGCLVDHTRCDGDRSVEEWDACAPPVRVAASEVQG